MVYYVADFETTVEEPLSVWLGGFAKIQREFKPKIQTSVKSFLKELVEDVFTTGGKEHIVFFHNLKFDGSYIVDYFIDNDISYDIFINDTGQWFSITVEIEDKKIVFRDSLKVLNFNLATIAQIFKAPNTKGETPLLATPPEKIEPEWVDYLTVDLEILYVAIKSLYVDEGFEKFTSASEALHQYKKTVDFDNLYPQLDKEEDFFIRRAYRGGWTFVKKGVRLVCQEILIYDVNSLYPSVMLKEVLPYGQPEFFEGEYTGNKPLQVLRIICEFEIKKDHLPLIQIKDKSTALELGVRTTDYVYSSNHTRIEMCVTNVDLALYKKHYNFKYIVLDGYAFEGKKGLFDAYIKKYRHLKENAKSPAEKQKAKIMLNSLYGKFGARVLLIRKYIEKVDGKLRYYSGPVEEVGGVYIPMSVFITAYARRVTITAAQDNYDVFCYADTDSIHIINDNRLLNIDVDAREFGKWAFEGRAKRGKYLRAKLYMEEVYRDDGSTFLDVKGAGMTDEIKKQVTFDNFEFGSTFKGKRKVSFGVGGLKIENTEFTIRESFYMYG